MSHPVSEEARKKGKAISLTVPSHFLPLLGQCLPPKLGLLPNTSKQLLGTELLSHTAVLSPDPGRKRRSQSFHESGQLKLVLTPKEAKWAGGFRRQRNVS